MERIREALDKARQERIEPTRRPNTTREISKMIRPTPQTQAIERYERWMSLSAFEVNAKRLMRNRIITHHPQTRSAHFDAMRTKLLHEMGINEWKRLAFTSPTSKCGKTTICMNLAFSLARQKDLRIIVIELDLRRPSISHILGLPKSVDFAAVMRGDTPAEDHIVRYGTSLAIAPSQATDNSAELLQGFNAAHAIDALEDKYKPDIMLFDVPPLLEVDDAMGFIDQIDAALLIGAAETTTMQEMTRCKQELEQRTNLMGVVLNKCRYPE